MGTTTHVMTADQLFWLPDDGSHHELVRGKLITLPFHGGLHGAVVVNISVLLGQEIMPRKLGTLLAASGFKLESNPDTVLAPDIAFIRKERAGVLADGYFDGAPDLAVEVLDDYTLRIEESPSRWLPFGASIVWLVDPETKTVEVCSSNGERLLLAEDDELTGGDLIPGFSVRVSEIFSY